jgi:hypothetical protein
MKYNLIFIFIICLFLSNQDYGQKIQILPKFNPKTDTIITPQQQRHLTNYPSLSVYLGIYFLQNNYIGSNNKRYQELCVQGKSYFKFTLEPNGILKNIVAIKGTPTFFVEILKRV